MWLRFWKRSADGALTIQNELQKNFRITHEEKHNNNIQTVSIITNQFITELYNFIKRLLFHQLAGKFLHYFRITPRSCVLFHIPQFVQCLYNVCLELFIVRSNITVKLS